MYVCTMTYRQALPYTPQPFLMVGAFDSIDFPKPETSSSTVIIFIVMMIMVITSFIIMISSSSRSPKL